jgi:hypothetical protein
MMMIYEDKIYWADPSKPGVPLAFSENKFKSAVLNYQIGGKESLKKEIVKRHLRDPEARPLAVA